MTSSMTPGWSASPATVKRTKMAKAAAKAADAALVKARKSGNKEIIKAAVEAASEAAEEEAAAEEEMSKEPSSSSVNASSRAAAAAKAAGKSAKEAADAAAKAAAKAKASWSSGSGSEAAANSSSSWGSSSEAAPKTFLIADAKAGSKTASVEDVTGFKVGDKITVGSELNVVAAIAGSNLILASPLEKDHPAGELVAVQASDSGSPEDVAAAALKQAKADGLTPMQAATLTAALVGKAGGTPKQAQALGAAVAAQLAADAAAAAGMTASEIAKAAADAGQAAGGSPLDVAKAAAKAVGDAIVAQADIGNLKSSACIKSTGSTCLMSACDAYRNAFCDKDKRCMCSGLMCAVNGVCQAQVDGYDGGYDSSDDDNAAKSIMGGTSLSEMEALPPSPLVKMDAIRGFIDKAKTTPALLEGEQRGQFAASLQEIAALDRRAHQASQSDAAVEDSLYGVDRIEDRMAPKGSKVALKHLFNAATADDDPVPFRPAVARPSPDRDPPPPPPPAPLPSMVEISGAPPSAPPPAASEEADELIASVPIGG